MCSSRLLAAQHFHWNGVGYICQVRVLFLLLNVYLSPLPHHCDYPINPASYHHQLPVSSADGSCYGRVVALMSSSTKATFSLACCNLRPHVITTDSPSSSLCRLCVTSIH